MKKLCITLSFLCAILQSFAQETQNVEMADALRSSGKIYVVVGVIAVIFLGIATYLFYMERRLSKLEKEQK